MEGSPEVRREAEPAAPAADRRWRFANVCFDERTLEVTVDGAVVALDPKPLEVLTYLLHHAGEVVTKDELAAQVWPRRILSETVLTKTVSRLREVLRDDGQTIIKTVHGYGYRLVAPVVIEAIRTPAPARFDFKPGDKPVGRPLWSLVRHLGAGGHGEAWLAKHDKTGEFRVFKFAIDAASLTALKREITLFRLLNSALGESAPIVPIYEWNLEQQPFFLESEFMSGGSWLEWAEQQGGLSKVPLATRLDIVAQIAEALAAIHEAGVLHKDLKPSNVFLESGEQGPRVRLADFGSGGLLDPKQLEAMGITRLGFTQNVAFSDSTSGTPLYLAPEVLAGQPPTVQSDLYALGVLLYQAVVGDFRRALSPGWERDVEDELLSEDIAATAEGDASRRLADAAVLTRRLRTLPQRRATRIEERATADRAAAVTQALERMRARRLGMRLAVVALSLGLMASTAFYVTARNARRVAEQEAQRAQRVSDYLSNDVLAALGDHSASVKNLTVGEMLDNASQRVATRFADDPHTAAQVDYALGLSYQALGNHEAALERHRLALAAFERLDGAGARTTLDTATQLITELGDQKQSQWASRLPEFELLVDAGTARLGADDDSVIGLRMNIDSAKYNLGRWAEAEKDLAAGVEQLRARRSGPEFWLAYYEVWDSVPLQDLGRFQESERELREAVQRLEKLLGVRHESVADARLHLGTTLISMGRFAEAEHELATALDVAHDWHGDHDELVLEIRAAQARSASEQHRGDAVAQFRAVIDTAQGSDDAGPYLLYNARHGLGQALLADGRYTEALAVLRESLSGAQSSLIAGHPDTCGILVDLAEALIATDQLDAARKAIAESVGVPENGLPTEIPMTAERKRVEAELLLAEHEPDAARPQLQQALMVTQALYGPDNWRVNRIRKVFDRLPQTHS